MIGSWEQEFTLTTPAGSLVFNQTDNTTELRFQLVPSVCAASLPVRTTDDDISQQDGKIPHRRFRSGYSVHLGVDLQKGEDDCPSAAEIAAMLDELGLHVNAMIRTGLIAGLPNARLVWRNPGGTSSADDRMFDRLQLSGTPTVATLGGELGGPRVELDFDTPYPYYMSAEEQMVVIGDTGAETVTNEGNTDSYPVVQTYGPTSSFIYANDTVTDLDGNPLGVYYLDTLPGAESIDGSDYVEFDHFRGSAYLNGNVARRLAGVDFRFTTFFTLIPGDNLLLSADAISVVRYNHAWA